MSEGKSLINFGDLSKPATVLVEKVSDAVGGIFRPHQIRRVARAEADAEKIRAVASIEISDLQRRAFERFVTEEAKKQENMEAITSKALPAVKEGADPSKVEDDWLTHFFEKARLVSDGEMQDLWGRVLAGEANAPGKFSKRTVNFLASLDKSDAELFLSVCNFGMFMGAIFPIIYDLNDEIYKKAGLSFANRSHLSDIGLITFDNLTGYQLQEQPKVLRTYYFGSWIDLEFTAEVGNVFPIGVAVLSKVGRELTTVCNPVPVEGFMDYLVDRWQKLGIVCSSRLQQRSAV